MRYAAVPTGFGTAPTGPSTVERDVEPGVARRPDQVGDLVHAGGRDEVGGLIALAQQRHHRGQLVEHVAARPTDRHQRVLRGLGLAVHDVGGGAGLHVDGRHRVRDAVVEVTRDLQAVLGDPPPGLLLARPFEGAGPLLELCKSRAPGPQHLAEEHRAGRPADEHDGEEPVVAAAHQLGQHERGAQGGGTDERGAPVGEAAHDAERDQHGGEERAVREAQRDVPDDRGGVDRERDSWPTGREPDRHATGDDQQPPSASRPRPPVSASSVR